MDNKIKKGKMWPRQESNLGLELRKLLYYPLYYEAGYKPKGCKTIELKLKISEFETLKYYLQYSKIRNITAEYFYCNGQ